MTSLPLCHEHSSNDDNEENEGNVRHLDTSRHTGPNLPCTLSMQYGPPAGTMTMKSLPFA